MRETTTTVKYIEKNTARPDVVKYEDELKKAQYDELSLKNGAHPTLKGGDVYECVKSLPNFKQLQKVMFEEQGGICCYCGQLLEYPNHPQYIVEHLKPKSLYRNLAGEYRNLLLSCRPTTEEAENIKQRRRKKDLFHCDKKKRRPRAELYSFGQGLLFSFHI